MLHIDKGWLLLTSDVMKDTQLVLNVITLDQFRLSVNIQHCAHKLVDIGSRPLSGENIPDHY